ncbi:MAG: outer membrane beta-barrel protein [Betaproteobacteria bacterium]|nr:outer membrane beta-barrel protein [Betaproteobacteria bacterium]
MRKTSLAASLLLAGLLAGSAQAADSGIYFGGSLGAVYSGLGDDFKNRLSSGFGSASLSEDKRDGAFRALLGYRFNGNFALEGSWGDYGKVDGKANTTLPLSRIATERETTALMLDLVGALPLGERFDLTGKIGAAFWNVETQTTTVLPVSSIASTGKRDQSGVAPHIGVGFQYRVSDTARATFDIEQFRAGKNGDTGRSTVTTVLAGFKINF